VFSNFTFSQLQFLYLGLKALIESQDGVGFLKGDPGHPVYQEGSRGKEETDYPDSPSKNTLYILLAELSGELKRCGIEEMGFKWWYDFSTWESFCKFAVKVAEK